MKRNQKAIFLVSVIMVLAMLAGCTSPTAPATSQGAQADPVRLTYWHENAGPDRTPIFENLINTFNESNGQNITVEYVGIPSDSALDKINVAIAAQATPDAGGVWDSWTSDIIAQGAAVQLDDYFDAWDEKDMFVDAIMQTVRSKTIEGNMFYMPYSSSTSVIWYRKDMFGDNAPPDTWEEFFPLVEALNDPANNIYGYSIRGGSGGAKQLLRNIISYVGRPEFFDADGKSLLRSPEALEYVTKYTDLYKNKLTPSSDMTAGWKEIVANFGSGVTPMILHNLGSLIDHQRVLEDDQYGAIPLPKDVNGKYTATPLTVNGGLIYSTCKNPDAAWMLLQHIASKDGVSSINQSTGEIPPRTDALESEWVKNAPHLELITPFIVDDTKVIIDEPRYLAEYATIEAQIAQPGFQEVMAGKKSPADFLNEWADALEKSNEQYLALVSGSGTR